jgi:hypothetical protein
MEIEKFEALLVEASNVRKGMIDFLYENRSALKLERVDSHYVIYSLGDWPVRVWTANDESSCRFYETLGGIELDHNECYTDEMRKNLWNMTREAICQNGERRRIEKTQMRNDLYFKFKGVHQDVKFTGYDDANWWNNHKPVEVKEDDSITWLINWGKMEAIYKPKN